MEYCGFHSLRNYFLNKAMLLLVLFSVVTLETVNAQRSSRNRRHTPERSPQQELIYDNKNYLPVIRSVQFHPLSKESSLPVYYLGDEEALTLSFDDLRADIRNYYFSIEHCTADWKSSNLSPLEYVAGFNEDRIQHYYSSVNTKQPYTHYEITFPSAQIKPTRSGNYLLKVYEDADKKRLVLTRKFYVVQPIFGINVQRVPSSNNALRTTNQKINITLETTGYSITNPYQQLNVVVLQNGRPDVHQILKQPSFVGQNEIRYHDLNTLDFPGGNEFRFLDIRSLRLAAEGVANIERDTLTQVTLMQDVNLSKLAYGNLYDENGAFFIRNNDREHAIEEADYAWVHFSLKDELIQEASKIKVYVVGAFNNYQRMEENELQYDALTHEWKGKLFLKQGLYDYEYIAVNKQTGALYPQYFSGNFYQTDNQYHIFVYLRRAGTTWDEIWGYKTQP